MAHITRSLCRRRYKMGGEVGRGALRALDVLWSTVRSEWREWDAAFSPAGHFCRRRRKVRGGSVALVVDGAECAAEMECGAFGALDVSSPTMRHE